MSAALRLGPSFRAGARLRLAAAALALLLPGLVLARFELAARPSVPTGQALLARRIGPWAATADQQLDAETLRSIAPDAYLMRWYEAPGRTPVLAYVAVYAGRGGYGKFAHDPKLCFPAQGWEIIDSEPVAVPLGAAAEPARKLLATALEARNGVRTESALYWFQPAGRWPAGATAEEALRILDALLGRPQYAFVRLSGSSDGSSAAARDLAEFAAEIAVPIRASIEERRIELAR